MRIQTRPIAGPRLVRDYLSGDASTLELFGVPATDAFGEKAAEVERTFPADGRARLARILRGGGGDRDRRLERFVQEEGFAVTTGQQPGLLGGPLFTLYKAFSAAALARHLEPELGRPVLPVFWIASQDHDWDEVRRCRLPDLQNELAEVALPEGIPPHSFHIPDLGAELSRARDQLLEQLPDSDFAPEYRALLEGSHGRGGTLAEAEARLLEGLLAHAGIFILTPEHPEAADTAAPVLLEEARHALEREEALHRRGRELEAAGHELQVPLLAQGLNLFLRTEEGRERLFRAGDGPFRTRKSGLTLSLDDLEERVRERPADLTPNVLLRPVVESALVPTLAYMAGPGESAYFPQTVPLFEAAGRTPPVVRPRLSGFVLESKVEKVLEKFGLEIDELDRPFHEIAGALAREEMPADLRQALGALRGEIARGTRTLAEAVEALDPTLKGTVDGVRRQGFSALDDVEKKITQAIKREAEVAHAQVQKAQLHLFPLGVAQERVISPFYYLFRYGPAFLTAIEEAATSVVKGDR